MRLHLKHIIFGALFLLFSRTVPAQNLPSLNADSRITQGKLRCGVTYYLVTNTAEKGYADVAVVQKGELLTPEKRSELKTSFLSRQGIGPGAGGYLSEKDGSSVYRFDRVPFYSANALDSTLLYAFVQAARSTGPQAVVVSGDIDPAEILKKFDIFSMLVPMQDSPAEEDSYEWVPDPAPKIFQVPWGGSPTAEVRVCYASARTPKALMNTSQALVSDILSRELRTVLLHRLEIDLRDRGIPYSDIRFEVRSSADGAGDEQYAVTVVTDRLHLNEAMRSVSSTVSALAETGVGEQEFTDARRVLLPEMTALGAASPTRADDVDRCIAHFLYGANLAPFSEETRLFARKNVSDSVSTALFNGFAAAVPRQLENLTLSFAVDDSLDLDRELFQYNLAYLLGAVDPPRKDFTWRYADTLGLERLCPRERIKSTRTEVISGGVIWTFSNGIRVAYRQVPGSGMFSYALLLNGGLAHIDGLQEGEGGYIADMLSLYDAGGLPARQFRDMYTANGIRLETQVDLNCMSVRGSAPRQKLPTVLRLLLSLANDREVNTDEFAVYARNEALRSEDGEARLRSLLHPGFSAAPWKKPGALSALTQEKAERYFEARFSRVNDGMLILSGDLDEATVRKALQKYIGGFRTLKGGISRKPVAYRSLSGTTTYTQEGDDKSVTVLMEAEYPLTAVNYMAAPFVEEALSRSLVRALDGTGLTVTVRSGFTAQPQERFSLLVTCRPYGEEACDLLAALPKIRSGIRSAVAAPLTDADIKAWQNAEQQRLAARLSNPETIVSQVLGRYAIGKDLVSKYTESIAAVDAGKVRQILEKTTGGGCVEYVIY